MSSHSRVSLTLERTEPQPAVGVGQPRGGGVVGGPGDLGVDVPLPLAALALDGRPAVVATGGDQVQLVEAVLPELRGPQLGAHEGETLDVAVPEGPHGGVRVGIAGCGVAVGGDPQDLAAQVVGVGGTRRVAGLTGGHVLVAVGSEDQLPAVVDEAVGDAGQHRLEVPEAVTVEDAAHDPVVAGGGEVEVDEPVVVVRRGDGHPEEPALARGRGGVDRGDLDDLVLGPAEQQHARGVALGHDRVAVRQERDAPRHRETGGDGADLLRGARLLRGVGPGRLLGGGRARRCGGRGGQRGAGRGGLDDRDRGRAALLQAAGQRERQHRGGSDAPAQAGHETFSSSSRSSACTSSGCSRPRKWLPGSST